MTKPETAEAPEAATRELLGEVEAGAGGVLRLILKITRILETQEKHAKIIKAQAHQIDELRDKVLVLQEREAVLLARAESAATAAATTNLLDLARRIGAIEARAGH